MPEIVAAFEFISENAPLWIKSLDDLDKSVRERQAHVAKIAPELDGADLHGPRRKLKKSGSNESIRPRSAHGLDDDGPDDSPIEEPQLVDGGSPTSQRISRSTAPPNNAMMTKQPTTRKRKIHYGGIGSSSFISTSDSLLVNNGTMSLPIKYRSRSMIIVYYDSEIQKSFETMVRNIGSARNAIRKAKMERLNELVSGASGNSGTRSSRNKTPDFMGGAFGLGVGLVDGSPTPGSTLGGPSSPLAMLRSTRSTPMATSAFARPGSNSGANCPMGSSDPLLSSAGEVGTTMGMKSPELSAFSAPSNKDTITDAFSEADSALENAQSLCERGAHTFLREGDCEAEVAGARESFEKAKRLADRELANLRAEEEIRKQNEKMNGETVETTRNDSSVSNGAESIPGAVGPLHLEVDDDAEDDDDEDLDALLAMPHSRFRLTAKT